MQTQYKYLDDYIHERRSMGKYSFSLEALRSNFKQSDDALRKALQRLKKQKAIAIIRREFYVIVPPEYSVGNMIPTSLFIDDLMKFLGRDYYVGLLNAAVYHHAAHQQPQSFSVITKGSCLREIHNDKVNIHFYIKETWSEKDIVQQKTAAGYIKISSPELTALDLVNYHNAVGGFNRVATVIEELAENMDAGKLADSAERYGAVAVVQRLGYLLEQILRKEELSNALYRYLNTVHFYPTLLRPQREKPESMASGNRWKVVVNTEVEIDDL